MSETSERVKQVARRLGSPEAEVLIAALEMTRWTGRPGYPVRAMVGMGLVRSVYGLPTWSWTARLVRDDPELVALLGCAPSQWACYRFARLLAEAEGAMV